MYTCMIIRYAKSVFLNYVNRAFTNFDVNEPLYNNVKAQRIFSVKRKCRHLTVYGHIQS